MSKPYDPIPAPQLRFAAELRKLWTRGGEPTLQDLAARMRWGRTTVSALLNGKRFPSWEQMAALAEACGERPEAWQPRWQEARGQLTTLRLECATTTPASEPDQEAPPIVEHLVGAAELSAHWYRNNPEFYAAATERVRLARAEIRLTYTRQSPPTALTTPASVEYFREILAWAAAESEDERCVRRIIGIPERDGVPQADMLAWARQHHEDTDDLLNYEARVQRWTAAADGLNMALIDDSVVFLAFSGHARQKLNGFSVEDRTFMSYFTAHFDQLWSALPSLGDYLADQGSQETRRA
ncbi:helix-turn-helix domain-containing protein [Streptomyces sp. NRRL WC-3742]|uniref:helix-turn-helix domain-containing protein n=1 Tax=Streptomyces sp. NRRL WC-3742 TaxID=1463934 RepID=UPI0004CA23EE|nr:helix-turn-helix transcriptional regulator [Streptomyces sp. NRRL WC-3742]